jgi:WD40-like Beta Propeller Repeat
VPVRPGFNITSVLRPRFPQPTAVGEPRWTTWLRVGGPEGFHKSPTWREQSAGWTWGLDIYVSQHVDESFGAGVLVAELAPELADQAPDVRHDGLEMFIMSDRAGTRGLADLWVSTRQTVFDLWSPPTNLGSLVKTGFSDGQPSLSSDRKTLYFTSNRPGGSGGFDLYMTTRTRKKGRSLEPPTAAL